MACPHIDDSNVDNILGEKTRDLRGIPDKTFWRHEHVENNIDHAERFEGDYAPADLKHYALIVKEPYQSLFKDTLSIPWDPVIRIRKKSFVVGQACKERRKEFGSSMLYVLEKTTRYLAADLVHTRTQLK